MDLVREIISKRVTPGVLIIDEDNRVLHSNHEARSIFTKIQRSCAIPSEIATLCEEVKKKAAPANSVLMSSSTPSPYALRAFYIDNPVGGPSGSHAIMVLVEKVVPKHEVDLEAAKKRYAFSRREVEVLEKICRGLTNKEIAEGMFISECTVKGHLKKIMKRMNVKCRSEIIAALR